MENFTKVPGLRGISEDIFKLLDKKSLMKCRLVNSSWKNVLEQPIFWLKKMKLENVPMNVQQSWKILAQQLEDGQTKKEFVLTLIKICKKSERILPMEIVLNLLKYPDLMMFLLEHENPNSTVKWKEFENLNPIHLATFCCFTETVKKLMKKYGSSILKPDGSGKTAIHCAAMFGHLDILKFLVNFTGTSLEKTDDGETPIFFAAMHGHLDIVKFLVEFTESSLDKNKTDDRKTPVFLAADNKGSTPIRMAALNGKLEIIKFLVNYTDDPCAPDSDGVTPILAAAYDGHLEVVKYLAGLTNTPNASHHIYGPTPIQLAKQEGHIEIVKFLEDHIYDRGSSSYSLRPRKRQRYTK